MRIPKQQVTTRRALIQEMHTRIKIGVQSVRIPPMWKDFSALQRSSSVRHAISLDILPLYVTKRSKHASNLEDHQLQAGTVYALEKAICSHSEDYNYSDDSFCLQSQVQCTQASTKKISTPTHLITNLSYRFQPYHTRNQYLRARLDTCEDVNVMPASVYSLLFKDPEFMKLDSCNMKIGTYTKDAVKIADSCKFHLVCPDTKKITGSNILCSQE